MRKISDGWFPAVKRCGVRLWLALVFGSLTAPGWAASPPAWLLEAAKTPPTPTDLQAPGEILRDETIITIDARGGWTETQRYAGRVCSTGGESAARHRVVYVEKSDVVDSANAWLLPAGRLRPEHFSRNDWLDAAAMNRTTLYTNIRWLIHVVSSPSPGDVYGAEVTVQRQAAAGQAQLTFGGDLPLRQGRLVVRLPSGWHPDLCWLKGSPVEPEVSSDGTVWTWEMRDVPPVKTELWAPLPAVPYHIALKIQPPAGGNTPIPRLATWSDFAGWSASIMRPQCDSGGQLKAIVAKLTTGQTDPWKKIEALTAFAQKQPYIQQYEDSAVGFGYRPRLASEVLRVGYGDCKDKANLLLALLREADIRAYMAIVQTGMGRMVQTGWPGQQFNHAIVAIELPTDVSHPAHMLHPVLGRLLFFDPTHPWIPLGQLPWVEHGAYALICDERVTGLTALPVFNQELAWGSATAIELGFVERGLVVGSISEITSGEPAAESRARAAETAPSALRDYWGKRLSPTLRVAKIQTPEDEDLSDGRHQTKLAFAARGLGQLMQDKFRVVRLDVLTRDTVPSFPARVRLQPVVMHPLHETQDVRLVLNKGETVQELPPACSLQGKFGAYTAAYTLEDQTLVYRRRLTLHSGTIDPAEYQSFRAFLDQVAKADSTAVLVCLAPATPVAPPAQ